MYAGSTARAQNGAEKIVRGADVGHPIAHGFVDGVLEGAAAGLDSDDPCAEQAHARDVEGLARHVFRTHVYDAFQAEVRRDGGGGDAVLACAGFCDDGRLAHLYGKQPLADGVVDLVRSGVIQIFALDVNARTAEMCREPRGKL
jgi:hypothetical protein